MKRMIPAFVFWGCLALAAPTAQSQTAATDNVDSAAIAHLNDSLDVFLSRPQPVSLQITPDPEVTRLCNERDAAVAALVRRGREAHAKQKYSNAVTLFKQALAIDETSEQAWEGLADAFAGQGKIRDAVAAYRALFGPHPTWGYGSSDTPFHRMKFVLLLLRLHFWDEALASYKSAYPELSPSHGDLLPPLDDDCQRAGWESTRLSIMAHLAMGYGNYNRDHKSGLPEVAEALRIAPKHPLACFYYGYMLMHLDRRKEAAPYFLTASRFGSGYVKEKAAQTYRELTQTITTSSK